MTVVTIQKAKAELSKLLKRVEEGEEIIIARGGKKIAKLTPIAVPPKKSRGYGAWKEYASKLPDSLWFDPLSEEELKLWYEGPVEPDC